MKKLRSRGGLMKVKWLLGMFFFMGSLIFSAEFKGKYEEGFIGIEINRVVEHTFFPVYMDLKEDEPYIGLKNIMILIDAGAMKLDKKNKRISGRMGEEEKEFSYRDTTYIPRETDVFIKASDLGKVFPLKKMNWDSVKYQLKIETVFKTPLEEYIESEERRGQIAKGSEGDIPEDEIYRNERKLFTPGVLKPRYTDTDLFEGDESISIRYDTHLLYGDFSSTYFFRPDSDLGNISLRYNEVLENKSIVAGDSFIQSYDFLNTSSVRGGAVQPWFGGSHLEIGQTTIKGFAEYRSTVELYQNGTLLRFQTVGENGQYEFDNIRIEGYEDAYSIRIYNFDGTIETRQLRLLSNRNIVKKGEFEYSGTIGKDPDDNADDDLQYHAKAGYGITDRLTVAAGYMDVLSRVTEDEDIFAIGENEDEDEEGNEIPAVNNKLFETGVYYTTGAKRYPTYFEISNLYDTNEGDNTHIGIARQRINSNVLSLEAYDYSEINSIVTGVERRYLADLRGDVSENATYNLFYSQRAEAEEDIKIMGGSLFLRYPGSSHSTGLSYPIEGEDETTTFRYSYSNSRIEVFEFPINLVFSATVDVEDPGENAHYSLTLSKRGTKKFDVSFETETDTEEYEFSLEVSYKLTDWLDILGEVTRDEDGTDAAAGIDAEKTIILEKPFAKNSNPSPDSSWMEGMVFLDYDGDGVMDGEDYPLEDVGVKVGRRDGTTDSQGNYFIDDISSYEEEEIEVDITTIDPLLEPSYKKKYAKLYPARGGKMDIPVQPISIIMGDIILPDSSIGEVEKFVITSKTYILLKDKKGRVVKEQKVEPEGYYMMERVVPGNYMVEIEYRGENPIVFREKTKSVEVKTGKYGDYYEGFDFEIKSFSFD